MRVQILQDNRSVFCQVILFPNRKMENVLHYCNRWYSLVTLIAYLSEGVLEINLHQSVWETQACWPGCDTHSPLCYFVCWQYKKCRNLLLAVNVRILFRQVEGLCMIPTCHFHSKKGSQIYIIMINKRTAFPTILFFLVCQILHSKYILFESNKYSNENINTE